MSANDAQTQFPASRGLIAGKTRIGWIGTGVMGVSMCSHIIKSSNPPYQVTVYNRTRSKAEPLAAIGAVIADTPEDVAAQSDIVFTMVGYPSDVRSVYLGGGDDGRSGILAVMSTGGVCIDMTTSEPTLAAEISAAGSKRGISVLDAPVSGGDIGARNATLSIMVGGDTDTLTHIRPLFDCLGKNITHCGPAGSGQHTKMTNQILIASNMIGVCEGLLYAQRAGLDLTTTISAVQSGAAGSWSISNLGPRIVKGDFNPGFYVEHFVKDLSIVINESRKMNLSLPGMGLAYQLYVALMAQGGGRLGTQGLFTVLEGLNKQRHGH